MGERMLNVLARLGELMRLTEMPAWRAVEAEVWTNADGALYVTARCEMTVNVSDGGPWVGCGMVAS